MTTGYTALQHRSFSINLRKLLKHYKVPQGELGRNLDVSQATVSRWVNGHGLPSPSVLTALAIFFKIEEDSFFLTDDIVPKVSLAVLLQKATIDELITAINNLGFAITLYPIYEKQSGV